MFFIYSILFSIPAMIFSILSWRLRTNPMFWLGIIFTSLLFLLYLYDIEFLISCFLDIDSMLAGLFFLILLVIPVFFLISSKTTKNNSRSDSDITDDYLNKIINSDEEEIDYE